MAKQKKKRKRPHIKITKKSKRIFSLVASLITIPSIVIIYTSNNLFYNLIKLLFNKDALYCKYSFNGFTILLFILLFIGSLFGIFWYENATSLKIEFKEYFSGKIANAKKQIKRTIISFIVLCVLFLTFLCFQIPSRVVATTDCITEYHLISKDTTINYNDIKSAKVEYRKRHIAIGRAGITKIRYNIVITINTENSELEFDEDCFNNNYKNIISFLNCIDSSKITTDKANTEKYLAKQSEYKDTFKKIFELD